MQMLIMVNPCNCITYRPMHVYASFGKTCIIQHAKLSAMYFLLTNGPFMRTFWTQLQISGGGGGTPYHGPGPRFTKNLKSDRNRKHISGAKMRFTKIIIL